MAKKTLDVLTESMFYILMALKNEPKCGTDIAAYISKKTNSRLIIGPATLYTILGKFEQEKYVKEISVVGRKRTYELTPKGREAYERELQRLIQCVEDAKGE
ncbi:MAG: helix-turn-helix transcriptional regulator [Eubacteriaceae bacterium]|nr:helix-turn-helix transcriptional regulator [Eubacteriaceae bacterium]